MYQALYRKWRPQSFSDVLGQTAVTDTLKSQIASGRISHAYLFAGSRGTGKTTCAKILAKAVNCEHPKNGDPCNECPSCRGITDGSITDVVEIDAASNNGVDSVRDLCGEAIYSPAVVKKRVYIIDEVHMFSSGAFNALLKTLEEPPEHVVFILATTELHKVSPTILSRCQRFAFKRISALDIAERIEYVARGEKITIEPEAAMFISRMADGAMRDALSIFDQCASYGNSTVSVSTVRDVIGLAGTDTIIEMTNAIALKDVKTALTCLSNAYSGGKDLLNVLGELSSFLRDILLFKTAPDVEISRLSAGFNDKEIKEIANKFNTERLISCITTIQNTIGALSYSVNRRVDAELCIIKICNEGLNGDYSGIEARIAELEAKLNGNIIIKNETVNTYNKTQEKPVSAKIEKTSELKKEEKASKPVTQIIANPPDFWPEFLAAVRLNLQPGVFPMLNEGKPDFNDNMLIIYIDNIIAIDLLNKRNNMEVMHNAAEGILGHKIAIKLKTPSNDAQDVDLIDELCDNLAGMDNVTIKP